MGVGGVKKKILQLNEIVVIPIDNDLSQSTLNIRLYRNVLGLRSVHLDDEWWMDDVDNNNNEKFFFLPYCI